MEFSDYQLIKSVGAGSDGVSFLAQNEGAFWELRRLDAAQADVSRWPTVARRLHLAKMLGHPLALTPTFVETDGSPPFAIFPWSERSSLRKARAGARALSIGEVVHLGRSLAALLTAAHRIGLSHGLLDADHIFIDEEARPKVDFTRLACRPSDCDAIFQEDPAADVLALGRLLFWLWLGKELRADDPAADATSATQDGPAGPRERTFRQLLDSMFDLDSSRRPRASEVVERLIELEASEAAPRDGDFLKLMGGTLDGTATLDGRSHLHPTLQPEPGIRSGDVLGRFRLGRKLGEGGMGAVFQAVDISDETIIVAVKILHAARTGGAASRRRFLKEGRLLAEVANPYVTRLIEANEDRGVCYLAMEFVAGRSARALLDERGRIDERLALTIAADAARGLAGAHHRGVIHRDIKPENILLTDQEDGGFQARLSDFGLARQLVQTESLELTQAGSLMGTPLYMAPEQFAGSADVGAFTDTYALGATLFHLIAGRAPFPGTTFLELMTQHSVETAPLLTKIAPETSEATADLVRKALSKSPAHRFCDADAMLAEIERILRGEPTSLHQHPVAPPVDDSRTMQWVFEWKLRATPPQLWPYVSNTERVNRAMGLPEVDFTAQPQSEGGSRRYGETHIAGMRLQWEEHPFEWIEGQRMGVLRVFAAGPFRWFLSIVDFTPGPQGGSVLRQRIQIEPRGLLGRLAGYVEIGFKARRALDRVYRRIDVIAAGTAAPSELDHFEKPTKLSPARQLRLEKGLAALVAEGADPEAVDVLGVYLANAPDQTLGRIRPAAVARRFGLETNTFLSVCLMGVHQGLLQLAWDVLCPTCRISTAVKDSLKQLREHEHCSACNIDFLADLNTAIEMIFTVHPDIRPIKPSTYCIGGPAHFPHVVSQSRLAAGERLELALALTEGRYRVCGPQLPWTLDLNVEAAGVARRWEVALRNPPPPGRTPTLTTGGQTLTLHNDGDQELLIRLERMIPREDVFTAAQAAMHPLFRKLFPGQLLAPGQMTSASRVTLLLTQLEGGADLYARMGEAAAFRIVQESFRVTEAVVRAENGGIIKTVSEGVTVVFAEATNAVSAALQLQEAFDADPATKGLKVRLAVHTGLAMIATHNDRLDYFGGAVKLSLQLLDLARGGQLMLTDAVSSDPEVDRMLQEHGIEAKLVELPASGPRRQFARRVVLPKIFLNSFQNPDVRSVALV